MQKISTLRRGKTNSTDLKKDNEIMHFSLQDALPTGHILALNPKFGTLSYLTYNEDRLQMITQEQFTNSELSVLLPLLEMFPYYCPYEVLYANFYNGSVREDVVEMSRERLLDAMSDGGWDQEMRPVRDALSRTRLKLRHFGIDISSILATGYILMIASSPMPIMRVS